MKMRLLWGMIILLLCAIPAFAQSMTPDEGYQEALRRIEEVRVSGATELDLSWLSLAILPSEIGQLVQLEHLTLYTNQLMSLPPEIGQLESLILLSIRSNQLTSLPPEIGQLKNLLYLNASNNKFKGLPPEIGQLTRLKELDLSRNLLMSLPPEIGQLTNLQSLALPNTLTFPPSEITSQGTKATLAYLRDYAAMQMRQTTAAVAGGVGAIAGVMLLFRWRQRRGLGEKKKRL